MFNFGMSRSYDEYHSRNRGRDQYGFNGKDEAAEARLELCNLVAETSITKAMAADLMGVDLATVAAWIDGTEKHTGPSDMSIERLKQAITEGRHRRR